MGKKLSFAVREFIGSFADLGTLLPLMLGLIICNGIGAGPTLVLLGLTYILTALYYRLPMPVQPMKALAMIAITTGASTGQIRASAYWMAAVLLILGITRIADKLSDIFPKVLIHVLQFNLGIMMVRTGVKFLLSYPASLSSFVPQANLSVNHSITAGIFPSISDFQIAFVLLVIPQLPLTLGNAVLATRDCALKYFGPMGKRVTSSRLAISMGIGNLAAALVGGMPICHGAGGMTAHYRLGARTGAVGLIIGSILLTIGILKGNSAAEVFLLMPAASLGILLAYVGVRHALLAGESFKAPASAAVLLFSGIAGWVFGNLLVSLGVGFAVKFILLDLPYLRKYAVEGTHG